MLVYVFLKHQRLESHFFKLYFPEQEKNDNHILKNCVSLNGKNDILHRQEENHENDSRRWKKQMENTNRSKTFCFWRQAHELRTWKLRFCCIVPISGEAPHGHEGEEDRVGTRIPWMTDIFLEILGADRVIRGKPKDRHKYFSLPFQMKQICSSRSESVALQKGCDSALWLIYSPHLVKRKITRRTGVESQAERGQQNNVLRASCQNLPADRFPRLPQLLIINSFR